MLTTASYDHFYYTFGCITRVAKMRPTATDITITHSMLCVHALGTRMSCAEMGKM